MYKTWRVWTPEEIGMLQGQLDDPWRGGDDASLKYCVFNKFMENYDYSQAADKLDDTIDWCKKNPVVPRPWTKEQINYLQQFINILGTKFNMSNVLYVDIVIKYNNLYLMIFIITRKIKMNLKT